MKKTFSSLTIFYLLSILSLRGQTIPPSLANKNVFKGEYPLTATFRGNNSTVANYTTFLNDFTKAGNHIPDLVDINSFYDTTNVGFANLMAQNYPDKLFLQVQQGVSGVPRSLLPLPPTLDRISALPISFPGHWVVKPPTSLSANIAANATTINVQSASGFVIRNFMPNYPNGCPAMIVETDALGNKLWNHFEYVYVTAVSGNNLTVTRAYRDSPNASSFTANHAIVAPILAYEAWQSPVVWYINFSSACPLDANGKTASQIIIDDLKLRFGTGKTLSNFSGLDYASGPFNDAPTNVDYNWDGIIDPNANYFTGVHTHLTTIRQQLGNDLLLLTGNNNTEYINEFNGLNNEGLIQPDDPWRGISDALNEVTYWSAYSALPYLTNETLRIQDNTTAGINNLSKWVQLTRMGNGFATCMGACVDIKDKIITNAQTDPNAVALTWVELYKGTENVEHWLGKPTSPPIRVAATTPSIMGNSATDWTNIISKLSFQNGTMSIVGGELVLVPDFHTNHSLTMTLNLSQTKNLTVLFDVISSGSQLVHIIKTPSLSVSYQTGADGTTQYTNNKYLTREYYWRDLDPLATTCTISLNFTGSDPIRFRSMGAYESPDCMARSFENGVVLVNPSLQDFDFNLTSLFGTGNTYKRLTAPNVTVQAQWQQQYQQTLEMNSGKKISIFNKVSVSGLNALFLISQPVVQLCTGNPNGSIISNLTGTNYQWQSAGTDNVFSTIADNTNYTGTNNKTLQLTNIPSSWTGRKYRCLVDGIYSKVFTLQFVNTWTGIANTAWENTQNWQCGGIPDANTEVIINQGVTNYPAVNSNASCKSLNMNPAASIKINTGFGLNVMGLN